MYLIFVFENKKLFIHILSDEFVKDYLSSFEFVTTHMVKFNREIKIRLFKDNTKTTIVIFYE